ncbi:hypothetical protein ACNI3K_02280 [Demequina sp. SO4-13]|uniref:hypothetical protein n=1 Tax=Demequina sp. SO4-13 TaxID=3401027 RepID=UPI003AF55A0B
MTDLATESPAPAPLLLPSHPLDEAHATLARALASLAGAQDVDWVSTAAAHYRSELAEMEVQVRRLMVAVDWARDDWHRARTLAWMHGQ